MIVRTADFVTSSSRPDQCPKPDKPEFAVIGRSNVGKSSLINRLIGRNHTARTSNQPGKTQTINHFLVNGSWYLVDLPGYGFAKVSQEMRYAWSRLIEEYLTTRPNLACTFVLVDSRLEPQAKDLDFIQWLGGRGRPLALVFTKVDKLSRQELNLSVQRYRAILLKSWSELPPMFLSSAEDGMGREEILDFIEAALKL